MSLFEVVEFQGGSGPYSMTLNSQGAVIKCSCPGFTYRKHCRHADNPSAWIPEGAKTKMPSKKELRERLTREQAAPLVEILESRLKALNVNYALGGSWRRGSPTIADLDVVIFDQPADSVDLGLELSRCGPKVASGDLIVADLEPGLLQVDLWGEVTARQRGAFMWFVTGPKELNIAMRAHALKSGWTLSQYGLMNSEGTQIDDGTEEDLAQSIGWAWMSPEDRDDWRARR